MTTAFCPICETERQCDRQELIETLSIRNEQIGVAVVRLTCTTCGLEFDGTTGDPLAMAYCEYRRRKGLLTPDEIKARYERWGLSRELFAKLIGISPASLYRYEQGGLQDDAHDRLIRSNTSDTAMLRLLGAKWNTLTPVQQRKVNRAAAEVSKSDIVKMESRLEGTVTSNTFQSVRRFPSNTSQLKLA